MSVRMAVRFRSFPALVLMLVVFVVNMKVLVRGRFMPVLQLDRIAGGPDRHRSRCREKGYQRQHGECRLKTESTADPSGQGIGNQPAGMGQGELRGENRRTVALMCRAAQQTSHRCLDQ